MGGAAVQRWCASEKAVLLLRLQEYRRAPLLHCCSSEQTGKKKSNRGEVGDPSRQERLVCLATDESIVLEAPSLYLRWFWIVK